MLKLSNAEIHRIAKKRYTNFIMNEGLANGKKIALEVYRLFKAEVLRRKKLKSKPKTKVKVKIKTGPPVVGRSK